MTQQNTKKNIREEIKEQIEKLAWKPYNASIEDINKGIKKLNELFNKAIDQAIASRDEEILERIKKLMGEEYLFDEDNDLHRDTEEDMLNCYETMGEAENGGYRGALQDILKSLTNKEQ